MPFKITRIKINRAKQFCPFQVTKPVETNGNKLDLQDHSRIHLVIHVPPTTPYVEQPGEVARNVPGRRDPILAVEGNEHLLGNFLVHRRKGNGYQFLILMKGGTCSWHFMAAVIRFYRQGPSHHGDLAELYQDHSILLQYHFQVHQMREPGNSVTVTQDNTLQNMGMTPENF